MTPTPAALDAFLARWSVHSGSELANYQLFLTELIALLDLPRPEPASEDTRDNAYVFERRVQFAHGDGSNSLGRIDLYRRGHFVCEAKKVKAGVHTRGFDLALMRARSQAEEYARALPADEGRPPFLIVVDVGRTLDLYAEFSRSGATYTPFPDPSSHRIRLTDLRRPEVTERLRAIWLDPLSLDPSRVSARVTREIAADLAELARSLEATGLDAERVAGFLTRCLFTLFAEDVELLPAGSFTGLLADCEPRPASFVPLLASLWKDMDGGGYSVALRTELLKFNGKLFKQPEVLALSREQIGLLSRAARHDWQTVEPAIFGTLLERALDPDERHALGAHYTPRAYVERLVLPTVIEPLRADWNTAQAAALTLHAEGDAKGAIDTLRSFHHQLCSVRVLDPACGSGNFLYVTLEHLKRLEGEVLNRIAELGDARGVLDLAGSTVDPHQFLGIELNPRAAAIAEMVLWIGYLQWHFRTRGHVAPPQPVLKDFHNIECRDAVLAHDGAEIVTDEAGQPVTRWDGRTMKAHPVTGEPVPDDRARIPLYRYRNPRKAEWPDAEFVVGNPPFIGTKRMKQALGEGYTEALRTTWAEVPESADLVMYWWEHAAQLIVARKLHRFGFITTNSLTQSFNRRVLERHLGGDGADAVSLVFGIPDHPWVDSSDGAAVRIAMTVCAAGERQSGLRQRVLLEVDNGGDSPDVVLESRTGLIRADLKIGADVPSARPLRANSLVAGMGVALHGAGFILDPDRANTIRDSGAAVVKGYVAGRDLLQVPRERFLIDFTGMSEREARDNNPAAYQHVLNYVKPERDENRREILKRLWWRFGWERPVLRKALLGLPRYIGTTETSKHRPFQFIDGAVLADHSIVCIACSDALVLGVLSSASHVRWALAAGARLGVGNDPRYNKTRCFDPFPFPALEDPALTTRIRTLAEQLDAHRKRQQAAHADLTLTGIYNVLEKLKAGEALSAKEKRIHEHGLVSVLKQLHDELDLAVLAAYGWQDLAPLMQAVNGNAPHPDGRSREDAVRELDEALLERLVALNAERAAEEARGLIRWLRPEFQNPGAHTATQAEIDTGQEEPGDETPAAVPTARIAWPKDLTAQIRAVADAVAQAPAPLTEAAIAERFSGRGRWRERLPRILETLLALGNLQHGEGRYRRA
ncbi:MAG: class I SAM-dependent DNA methyltransferase [Xanthomonadales bacterium]|nr:hypothetical protein [Xanthomonadales bacterium]MCC6593158.1 class I SAM-dependent DNA methyltransferase [Xanthomonadales bacterium]